MSASAMGCSNSFGRHSRELAKDRAGVAMVAIVSQVSYIEGGGTLSRTEKRRYRSMEDGMNEWLGPRSDRMSRIDS